MKELEECQVEEPTTVNALEEKQPKQARTEEEQSDSGQKQSVAECIDCGHNNW